MGPLRRKLRALAATWLVFQAAWLTALVPRDCCAGHRPAETTCHETAAADHHAHTPSPASDCQLSANCDGPMAALFTLLSNHAVLPEPADSLPDVDARDLAPPARESVAARFESPDAPPPRA